jgi:hypothetical protein
MRLSPDQLAYILPGKCGAFVKPSANIDLIQTLPGIGASGIMRFAF